MEQIANVVAGACPLKRMAEPVDVARVVAFLISDEGEWVMVSRDSFQLSCSPNLYNTLSDEPLSRPSPYSHGRRTFLI